MFQIFVELLLLALPCLVVKSAKFPLYPDISTTSLGIALKIQENNESVAQVQELKQSIRSSYLSATNVGSQNLDESKLSAINYIRSHADTSNIDSILELLNHNESLAKAINYSNSCSQLNLSSQACERDCSIYSNYYSLLSLLSTDFTEFAYIFSWYLSSGSALSENDNGNYDMCLYYYGTYCYTPAEVSGSVAFQHGCCIPGNCTGDDAVKVVSNESELCYGLWTKGIQGLFDIASITTGDIAIYCDEIPRHFDAFSIIIILIFVIFLFLVCITSSYKQLIEIEKVHVIFFQNDAIDDDDDDNYNNYNNDNNYTNDNLAQPAPSAPRSSVGSINSAAVSKYTSKAASPRHEQNHGNNNTTTVGTIVSIFCIQDSWKNFISARKDKDLNFLDGIRWWSMCWVVFGHAFFFNLFCGLDNERTVFPYDGITTARDDWNYAVNNFYTTFALQGFFSVDSFFWLSGLLAFWSLFKMVDKFPMSKWPLVPFLAYLFRYLRLGPMLIYVTLLNWKISDQLPEGPHVTTRDAYGTVCADNWWKVFGLFGNLYNLNENSDAMGCMGHLWYIECDFQMFLILPFMAMLYHIEPFWGMLSAFTTFLTCIAIRIYYGYYYHFAANMIIPGISTIHNGNQGNDSYYKPWTRMGTYFAGVLCMMIIQSTYKNFKLTKLEYLTISVCGAFILCSLTFWPFDDVVDAPSRRWGLYQNIWYYALSRPGWGVGLSLLAYGIRFGVRKENSSTMNNKKSGHNKKKASNNNGKQEAFDDQYIIIGRDLMMQERMAAQQDDAFMHDYKLANGQRNNNNNNIDLVWENYMLSKHLLSFEAYQPLAKLTYTMYLVHILIYYWYIEGLEQNVRYSVWEVLFLFLGILTITFVIALVLWHVMERPISNMVTLLMKCMMGSKGKRNNNNNNKQYHDIEEPGQLVFSQQQHSQYVEYPRNGHNYMMGASSSSQQQQQQQQYGYDNAGMDRLSGINQLHDENSNNDNEMNSNGGWKTSKKKHNKHSKRKKQDSNNNEDNMYDAALLNNGNEGNSNGFAATNNNGISFVNSADVDNYNVNDV